MVTLIHQDFAMAAVGEPVSCWDAVSAVRWPWQGEQLFSVEKKLLGAKTDLKLSVTGSRVFAPRVHSRCLRFLFSILAWLFHHLFGLFFLHALCHADPSLAAGYPCGGAGQSWRCLRSQGGQELPRTTSQSLSWPAQCLALSSQLPGLGFLQASLLTFHTFKESSAAPFFSYCISCSIKAICSPFCIQSLHSSHLLHFC